MPTNPVAAALDAITLGPAVVVSNLTMIPLIAKHQDHGTSSTFGTSTLSTPSTVSALGTLSDYLVLDEALASGLVEITEISEQGSVPDLKFINRGPRPVLIVDGEELLGAKQNRIVNLTILVAANSELTIPVSCVEAGRWRSRSRAFTSASRTQFATGRAKRMASVSISMMARGDRMSDQAEVWDDIAHKSSRMNASSPTAAMGAIFSMHAESLDAFVDGLQPVDGQVGAMFTIGGRVIGFDLFDRPSTLRKVLPKLVRSAAIDAIDESAAEAPVAQTLRSASCGSAAIEAMAHQFLAVTASAPPHVTPALGLGEDLRVTAPHIAGAALVNDQRVVHLSAFAL